MTKYNSISYTVQRYLTNFYKFYIHCFGIIFRTRICQLLGPGSLNLGRRGLLTTVEDRSLVTGMWCLAVIEKSPGLRAVSFILDSGLSSG